jgi:hypothetical protein
MRDVVEARTFSGPRGGTLILHVLECGHAMWRRIKQPMTRTACVGCYMDSVEGLKSPVQEAYDRGYDAGWDAARKEGV